MSDHADGEVGAIDEVEVGEDHDKGDLDESEVGSLDLVDETRFVDDQVREDSVQEVFEAF